MEEIIDDQFIPAQVKGSKMDVVEKREYSSILLATKAYELATSRLLKVNNWGEYAGFSTFQLIDENGIRAEREAIEQDFIRIDIPGPGTHAGMGFDWVRIENIFNIENEYERLLCMRVRPCSHPLSKNDDIAHFLKKDATSSFVIRQRQNIVFAEEHGRNEMANTDEVGFYDKSRNFVVGIAAKVGFSYPQWKSLVKGLLKD